VLTSILPNLAKACLNYVAYSILGNERRKYRAKGRYYHYSEMLALARKQRRRAVSHSRA